MVEVWRSKRACEPSKSRLSPPPARTGNPKRDTSAAPTSRVGVGYLIEEALRDGRWGDGGVSGPLNFQSTAASNVPPRETCGPPLAEAKGARRAAAHAEEGYLRARVTDAKGGRNRDRDYSTSGQSSYCPDGNDDGNQPRTVANSIRRRYAVHPAGYPYSDVESTA
ncbi:hypothetical protein EVAR_10007_1 [Eumeta japonica]|uniref:Uncharacterized protein n=1 Tax=Eumeta variegata TaxID=151549 RepID=A0A4C1TR27_EUMVA|nr:hypothetical protein EVAR_10007_1 [Eumeta japonica]